MKKQLSMPGMLETVRSVFKKVKCSKSKNAIPIDDVLMSGLVVFNLKYPSLLKYDQERNQHADNFRNLFGINKAPSDTYLRERLDEINYKELRPCFKKLFRDVQRSKYLEPYQYLNGCYLVSLDGTGYFSSNEINCDECCQKQHRDGSITYYHQLLQAAVVHPDLKQVIPFAPEPISKQDGAKKNDCERNAAKRLLSDIRREHPHLSITILGDALYANDPFLEELKQRDMRYIIGVKPGDHTWLFDYVEHHARQKHEYTDENKYRHQFEFINGVPLNETHEDRRVNFLSYTEISPKGDMKKFTWITDFCLAEKNVYRVMRGGVVQGGASRMKPSIR